MPLAPHELITTETLRRAEAMTMTSGISGIQLMENAGEAIVQTIVQRYSRRPVLVLVGHGKNGGDGYIIARKLKEIGWTVKLCRLFPEAKPRGDVTLARQRFLAIKGKEENFKPSLFKHSALIVDAIFGIGLTRAPEGHALAAIRAANDSGLPIVAVDVPSGVIGDTGEVPGEAIRASVTVTFFRAKPGLLVMPGKEKVGELYLADIHISGDTLSWKDQSCWRNHPDVWRAHMPQLSFASHKFTRGHAVIAGGPASGTGAARLSALAAQRSGAGLVTIACDLASLPVYASHAGLLTRPVDSVQGYANLISDKRVTALLLGPGQGITQHTHHTIEAALATKKPVVLDADALTVMAQTGGALLSKLHPHCVLTPHEGEFGRLYGNEMGRLSRARAAARESRAVVLLKGSDTIIAAPDGRVIINDSAPPWLATAGSGDVLAGLIAGLMAQGMDAFHAAAAGVWLHSRAAHLAGKALVAEDLLAALPGAFRAI